MTLGNPANGSTTSDTTPSFWGTAGTALGDSSTVTVKVYSGPDTSGPLVETLTATVDASGAWAVDATTPLPFGAYTAQASQSDGAGTSARAAPTRSVVQDGPPGRRRRRRRRPIPVLVGAGDITSCGTSARTRRPRR